MSVDFLFRVVREMSEEFSEVLETFAVGVGSSAEIEEEGQ